MWRTLNASDVLSGTVEGDEPIARSKQTRDPSSKHHWIWSVPNTRLTVQAAPACVTTLLAIVLRHELICSDGGRCHRTPKAINIINVKHPLAQPEPGFSEGVCLDCCRRTMRERHFWEMIVLDSLVLSVGKWKEYCRTEKPNLPKSAHWRARQYQRRKEPTCQLLKQEEVATLLSSGPSDQFILQRQSSSVSVRCAAPLSQYWMGLQFVNLYDNPNVIADRHGNHLSLHV